MSNTNENILFSAELTMEVTGGNILKIVVEEEEEYTECPLSNDLIISNTILAIPRAEFARASIYGQCPGQRTCEELVM